MTFRPQGRPSGNRIASMVALGVAGALLFATGCASPKPAELFAADTATEFHARRLDDAGLKQLAALPAVGFSAWPPSRFDRRALEVAALYFNPALQVARAKWQVAVAAVATAGQLPNPTLSLSPQYVATAIAGVSPWVVAASLVQIVETAGKRQFRVARAEYLAEAARLDALNAAWDTVGKVDAALVAIAAAQARIAAIERQVTAQSGLVEIAEKRLQAGLGSQLELTTARTVLNRAILDRQAAEAALADARQQLALAVGVPSEALPFARLSIPPLDEPLPLGFETKLRETAALNRADLLARLADYAASAVGLQLDLAGRYPNLELGPTYEYDQGDRKWGLSLGFQLPILNQNQGAIGEAAARRQQAADEFVSAQAAVIGEVERAISAYREAERSLLVANRLLEQQSRLARAQEALFAHGETNRLDLLAARVELAAAGLGLSDALSARAKARLALELAGHLSTAGFDPAPLARAERR